MTSCSRRWRCCPPTSTGGSSISAAASCWTRYGALAAELGIADRVVWKGALAQDEVLAHYRQADIFALACRITADGDRDGLPNVLVEASSQGLVCVSTNISGVPELLDDGDNGLVVPPDDPAALAAALERAMRDPALRQRLGEAAEQKVRTHFDYHSSIRQLAGLFEREWRRRTMSGAARPLLRPASARHRPSRPRQPGCRRARRRRIRRDRRDRRHAGPRVSPGRGSRRSRCR